MKVHKITKPQQYLSMLKWLDARRLELPMEYTYEGFMVNGVAACQLIRVHKNLAIMDSLVTNPYATSETRDKALDDIFKSVTNAGYGRIIGFTMEPNVALRAVRHGFNMQPHALLTFEKGDL